MSPKIKNILIYSAVGLVIVLAYVYLKPSGETKPDLVSSSGTVTTTALPAEVASSNPVASDFLSLLLSIRSINLDDSVLSRKSFTGLHDSSIVLERDPDWGRKNPFAPIGSDTSSAPTEPAIIDSQPAPSAVPQTSSGAGDSGIGGLEKMIDTIQ